MSDAAFAELRSLVNEWDPLGVFGDDAPGLPDEYDCVVGPVLGILDAGGGAEEVARFLARHVAEHMVGEPSRPPTAGERTFATKVARWYEERTGDPVG